MAPSRTEHQVSNTNLSIILLLVTLLVVGASGLIAKNLITGIIRNTKVVDAKTRASNQLDLNLQDAPRLVDNYRQLGDRSTLIAAALPDTTDLPGLLVLLENISSDAGLKLKSVEPGFIADSLSSASTAKTATDTSVDPPKPKTFAVNAALDGSYPTLQKFVADMELSARPLRIDSIQLSGSGNALSAQLGLTTYYQDKGKLPYGKEVIK